jgi:dTDP-glucose pyrophosphorylase
MFRTGEQAEQFARLRSFIESKVRGIAVVGKPPMSSTADEIAKYAGLRDLGIITDDEFQKKKRSLLDL